MNSKKPLEILIVGAGIAGSALFGGLKKLGHTVDIIEKQEGISSEGAGICLPGNAMKELKKLGFFNEIMAQAHQVNNITYTLADGNKLAKAPLDEAPLNSAPFVALPRQKLLAILTQDIKDEVIFGCKLKSIDNTEQSVAASFSNGRTKEYDLVIAADGINSQVRSLVFPTAGINKLGVTNWRFTLDLQSEHGFEPVYYVGNDSAFMIYPLSSTQVYCYGQVIDKKAQYLNQSALNALQTIFSGYAEEVKACIAKLNEDSVIITGELKSVSQVEPLHQRVLLIGDALHGCPPSLQQGVGMAMEDVNCLVEQLQNHPIDQALKLFVEKRQPRISWTVDESNKIIKLANLGRSFLGRVLRNYIIRKKGPANVEGWRKLMSGKPY